MCIGTSGQTTGHLIGNSSAVFLGHQRAFFARNFLALFSEKQIIKICSLQGCVICVSSHIVYINGSDLLTRRSSHSSSLMVSQTLNMIGDHWGRHSVVFCLYFFWEPCGQINVKDIKPPLEQFCMPALELWRTPPLSPSLNILWWTEVVKSVLLRF